MRKESRADDSKANRFVDKPSVGFYHHTIVNRSEVSEAARLLGKVKSPKKARAARENGKLGGRPRKNRRAKQLKAS